MNTIAYALAVTVTLTAWLLIRSFGATEIPAYFSFLGLLMSGVLYIIFAKALDKA